MKAVAVAMAILVALPAVAVASGRVVVLTSIDGTPLAGMLYEPSNRPAPAVVLVHMLGRSKDDWGTIAEQLEGAGAIVLAVDLRGHGRSGGSASTLSPLVQDVRAAVSWVAARPGTRPGAVAVVGGSLGASLALLAALDNPSVQAVGMVSPALDYRGVRVDAATVKKLGGRPLWMAASTGDPYALRTLKELATGSAMSEQRLSQLVAHGTNLLSGDPELARGLVDWLRRTLVF